MDPDEEMRTSFDMAVAALLRQKREDNKAFLSADEYECRVREVKRSRLVLRTAGEKKTAKDYRMVRKYAVTVDADGRELLVKPATGTPYVTNEQLFDVLHKAHLDIGHGGRNRMVTALKARYSNVTKEAVMTYLKLCTRCVRSNPSAAQRPCAAAAAADAPFGRDRVSRARIELIDMQERAYDGYRFVVRHRDHVTKFVHLIALRSIRPEEVARGLLDVYAAFGVPAVLESLCGGEYVGSVIEHIRSVWGWARIEYAEPEPRGRGKSGDREHVIKMLDAWEEAQSCDNWPLALRHVQLQKNCEVHPAIGMTPYQAMFGYPPSNVPLSSFDCKYEVLNAARVDDATVMTDTKQQLLTDDEATHFNSDLRASRNDSKDNIPRSDWPVRLY